MKKTSDSVGFYLCDNARLIKKVFNRRVKELDITRSQWAVLWRLSCANGMSQAELAEQAEIEQPSLVRHVDNLEQQGWITRKRDMNDRRINRIHLTPKGEALMEEAWQHGYDIREEYSKGLSETELEQLRVLLAKVKENLSRMDVESSERKAKSA